MSIAPQPAAAPADPEPPVVESVPIGFPASDTPASPHEQIYDPMASKLPPPIMATGESPEAPPVLAPLRLAKSESSGTTSSKQKSRLPRPEPASSGTSAGVWVTVGLVLLGIGGVLAFSIGAAAWFFTAGKDKGQAHVIKVEFNDKNGKQGEKIIIAPPVPNLVLDANGRATINEDQVFGKKSFRVELRADQHYNFQVSGMFGMQPRLEIDDGAGAITFRESNKDVFLSYLARRTGSHIVHVIPRFGANNVAFNLRFAPVVPEPAAPIELGAEPSVVQGALRMHDSVFGDQLNDYGLHREYTLSVKAGNDYLFKVGANQDLRPALLLLNEAILLTERPGAPNNRVDYTYHASFTGKLRVIVATKVNLPGDFTLTVSEEGPGPRQVAFDFAGKYLREDNLAVADPLNPRLGRVKTYYINMEAGLGYNIEQRSVALDAFLALYDPDDNLVVDDNNSGGNFNARILFDPKVTGKYRLLAGDFKKATGGFTIDIAQFKLPASAPAKNALAVRNRQQNGCDIAEAPVPGMANISSSFAWANDGKAFYVIEAAGILRRYRYPELVEERRVDLGVGMFSVHASAEGILVSRGVPAEMWVFDPQTLDLKRRIVRVGSGIVHTRPALDLAFTATDVIKADGSRTPGLARFDLKRPSLHLIGNLTKGSLFHTLTPDGRFIFSREPDGKMARWRIDEKTVANEEISRFAAVLWTGTFNPIVISADSKLLAHPVQTRGVPAENQPPRTPSGSGIAVYEVSNLQKPLYVFDTGFYTSAVAFDKTTGLLCAFNKNRGLMVVNQEGKLVREMRIDLADPVAPTLWHMVPHPDGGALLGFCGNVFNPKLMSIKLPKDL
jgi:hypothetical protein